MTKFHIAEVCDNVLTFEDGSRIVCGHRRDCRSVCGGRNLRKNGREKRCPAEFFRMSSFR